MILKAVLLGVQGQPYIEETIHTIDDLPEGLRFEGETVMAVDPGTNAMGIAIASADGSDFLIGVLKRVKTHKNESDTTQYIIKAAQVLGELASRMGVKHIQMEDQYLDPRYVKSYTTLTSLKDILKGTFLNRGMEVYLVKPQTWKASYLEDMKKKYNINLNKSNKDIVYDKVTKKYPRVHLISEEDATDAYGMLYYYFAINKTDEYGAINIVKDMEREQTHDIFFLIGRVTNKDNKEYDNDLKDISEVLKKAEEFKQAFGRPEVQKIFLTEELNIEQNVRSMSTKSNDVFVSIFNPYLKSMGEIMKERRKIGRLNPGTLLYIIALRTNLKR